MKTIEMNIKSPIIEEAKKHLEMRRKNSVKSPCRSVQEKVVDLLLENADPYTINNRLTIYGDCFIINNK